MSKLIEGMVGEYIFISSEIVPPTAIWYNNKTVIKTEPAPDIVGYAENILKMMKVDACHHLEFMNGDAKFYVNEIVLTEKGVSSYSLLPTYFKGDAGCRIKCS
ncbi:MAG: hypothetical protein DRG78_02790 [Epsilonproteobacteria bacterium]|nr:MAG: hypothetical protein DRG78_02790 [Campylobacterota bacterium]